MKVYSITVRGRRKEWCFDVLARPEWAADWQADGLIVDEVLNAIPQWWVELGLPVTLWCWLQDIGLVPALTNAIEPRDPKGRDK